MPKKPVEPPPKKSIRDQLKDQLEESATEISEGTSYALRKLGELFWKILIVGFASAMLIIYVPRLYHYLTDPVERVHNAALAPNTQIDRSFLLLDQHNQWVTDNQYSSRTWVVFFGFTHCPDTCPLTLSRLSSLWPHLARPDRAQVFFVTVDPERDTPEVLADYMKAFDPSFEALTGPTVRIQQIENNFHVYAKKVSEPGTTDYSMDHTATVFLLRSDGVFAGTIDINEPDEVIVGKINALTGK